MGAARRQRARKAGMERKDLLGINGKIFTGRGQAIKKRRESAILVIGNPATRLPDRDEQREVRAERSLVAMTRLDERAKAAQKAGVDIAEVNNVTIWGSFRDACPVLQRESKGSRRRSVSDKM
jgi:malate dehydrogenase